MKHVILTLIFWLTFFEVESQCLDAPDVMFGGSKVEWSIPTIDTFVKSPCFRYITPREMFSYRTDPIEVGGKVIYALTNTAFGTVLQGINHVNGEVDWINYYNQSTENGYGYNYYMNLVKKSDFIFELFGVRSNVTIGVDRPTVNFGHLNKRTVSTLNGNTILTELIDSEIINYVTSTEFHKNNGNNTYYNCNFLGSNNISENNFGCIAYNADFDQNIIQIAQTDTIFFNTKGNDGSNNPLRADGPYIYGDSLYVYISQYRQNGFFNQYLWSVDRHGKIKTFKDISSLIHCDDKRTYLINSKKVGEDILLTTVSPDESYEGNYGYVILSNEGSVQKSNPKIVINGKKIGFSTIQKIKNSDEILIATRLQGQNDLYFYKETLNGDYIESAHLINPNKSVYALSPYYLLQTNDNGFVLTGHILLDTFKQGSITPFQVGGWPVIMKLSAETLGIPTSTSDVWHQPITYTITPNPTTDIITITISEGTAIGSIQITDQTGRIVALQDILTSQTIMDISALHTGLYFVTLIDQQGKRLGPVQKVVKM